MGSGFRTGLLERNWRWIIVALVAALAVYVGTGGPTAVFGQDPDEGADDSTAEGDIAVSVGTKWANVDEFCDDGPDSLEGDTLSTGDTFWYCIEIEVNQGSDGDGVIQDLVIEDYLPTEVTPTGEYVANVLPESICGVFDDDDGIPPDGWVFICDIGTVNAGQTIVVAVEVTVNGTDDDDDLLINNVATFRDDANTDEGENVTSESVVLIQPVSIFLDKEVSDDTVMPGGELTFWLYVDIDENDLSAPIWFNVQDPLPSYATLDTESIEVSGAEDYDCSASSTTVLDCDVYAEFDVTISFTVTIDEFAAPGEYCNYFYVTDDIVEVDSFDNFDCYIVLGEGLRHLDPWGFPLEDIDDQNNLVGYTHEICLFGIDADAFNSGSPVPVSAWIITPLPDSGADVDGDGPDAADPGPPSVNSAVTFQEDVDGDGTDEECIRYTSFTPGEQTVVLRITDEINVDIDEDLLPENIQEYCDLNDDVEKGLDSDCELVFDFYGWVDPNDGERIQQPLIKEWNLLEPTIIAWCYFYGFDDLADRGGFYFPVECPEFEVALDEEGNEYIVGPENIDGETIEVPAIQNPVDGTWFSVPVAFGEYVVGSHFTATLDEIVTLVDGAVVTITVEGNCGFIVVYDPGTGTTEELWYDDGGSIVIPETVGEPIPFIVNLFDCQSGNAFLTVHIQASYPAQIGSAYPEPAPETITVRLVSPPPVEKVPLAPWAGTRQPVQHNWFLNDSDDEDREIDPYTGFCVSDLFDFFGPDAVRGEGELPFGNWLLGVRYNIQSGNAGFIGNEALLIPGFPNTTTQVIVGIDEHCNSTAVVEAEDQGEVDVEMELVLLNLDDFTIVGASASKVAQPLFFLKLEDLTLGAPAGARLGHNSGYWSPTNPYIAAPQDADITTDVTDLDVNVSADALIRARVRGWFVNSNPGPHDEEVKTDALGFSYTVPDNRWVLPDDWEALAGGPTAELFRPGWDTNVEPVGIVVCEWTTSESAANLLSIVDVPQDLDSCGDFRTGSEVETSPVAGPFSPLHTKDPYADYSPFVNDRYPTWRVLLPDADYDGYWDTAYGGYIPDGDVDWWDAPMQPAQLTWWLLNEQTGDAGGFVPTDKTDIYRTAASSFAYLTNPFYATHIPFSAHVVGQAAGGGFLWDTFNDYPDNDGFVDEYDLYYFWEPALINEYPVSGAEPVYTVNEFGHTVVRTHTIYTDNHGEGMTYINGDHIQSLLTFEDCDASFAAGPDCAQGDVVGHSTVIATVDYPDFRKHPQVNSANVVTIDWIWGGFKDYTVETTAPDGTDLPTFRRAIVLHLLDRDGYCGDSPSIHPVEGELVEWTIDSGEGVFIDGEEDFEVGLLGLSATTYTFDASEHDPDRTYPTLDPNECQTWVIVQNSLQTETNVFFVAHDPEGPVGFDVILFGDAGIEVTKTADVEEAHVGDTVTYTVTVTNTGTSNVTDVVLTDSLAGELVCDLGDGILVPEEEVECEYTYTVLDTDADPLENVVTVTGTAAVDGVDTEVSDEASAEVDILHPEISVQKTGPDVALVTTEATYTFIVTNSGDATLHDVTASDDVLGELDACEVAELIPGEQITCTATTELGTVGVITNTVSVAGTDALGTEVTATDSHDTDVMDIEVALFEGWNEIHPWMGVSLEGITGVVDGLSSAVSPDVWEAVAHFENTTQTWTQTFKDAPLPAFNTLGEVETGSIYWIFVTGDATLTFPLP